MNPNNQNVNQLMEITQLTEDQAKLYLEIYGDNLEVAVGIDTASNQCRL